MPALASMSRLLPWALIVTAALALGACSRPAPAPEPVRAVRTLTVERQAAQGQIEFAAEIRARAETRLSFRVAGKLTQRLADLGDSVRAGQVLARLDAQDLRQNQDAALSALSAAQANLALAEADLKRFRDLRAQGFIGEAELERRETTYKAARAQAEQARSQATVQGNLTGYAVLKADAAGVVTGVEAEPGQVLAAGSPVLRLALDGPRDAVFAVPEDKAAWARALAGRPGVVTVRPWGGGAPVPAVIREVAAAADPATRTFLVKADVGRADLRLGQTAQVAVATPQREGVVRLPLQALVERQGETLVWLLDTGTMTVGLRKVRVDGAEGNEALVVDGLAPGQMVVTAGVHVLTPGQKVRLYREPGAPAAAPPAATPPATPPATAPAVAPPASAAPVARS
jgi:membrane fusion protein, multidrug efflux system